MYKYKSPPALTFSHRSGVTPYTSSYELAGSCVFDKQSPEILSLRPRFFMSGQALSRSYGRFFAEFLNEDSPVPLRLLASPTCGGLRYGLHIPNLRGFSWKRAQLTRWCKKHYLAATLGLMRPGFTKVPPLSVRHQTNKMPNLLRSVTPSKDMEGPEY